MADYKYLKKFAGKKIALLGLGLDNRALFDLFKKNKVKAEIVIKDARQDPNGFNKNLYEFDVLFRSPGWPLACPGIQEAIKKGQTEISSPLNLFFALCPSKKIIGITGSKGKGTTASIIYRLLKEAGKKAWLGGNIGISPLSFIDKIKKEDYVVLELSSFQLEDLNFSPQISVLTNLYREHLAPADPNNPNFHSSFQKYFQAKLNIAKHQENKYFIVNNNLKSKLKNYKFPGKLVYFSPSSLRTKLIGTYNQENIGASLAVARLLKIKEGQAKKTIADFKNLEHRLEFVTALKGVRYYDNSFSTTPESTSLDLMSFTEPIILIAGGADKAADFKPLAKLIKKRVKALILLPGEGTKRFEKAIQTINMPTNKIFSATDMMTAVKMAKQKAATGDVVLLSAACASFGIFKNYKERGDLFKKYVRQ